VTIICCPLKNPEYSVTTGRWKPILEATSEPHINDTLFKEPTLNDGAHVWQLVKDTKVLDLNSSYSYLLWCDYFSETSIVAKVDEEVVGFVSGFVKPNSPNTLFIWQVAVAESQRGKGIASRMIKQLLSRDVCKNISFIETTITPSNGASQHLFKSIARDLSAPLEIFECFSANQFPEKGHEDEQLHQIGPIEQ